MTGSEQSDIGRYRKKPVEIHARRVPSEWQGDAPLAVMEIARWCGGYIAFPAAITIDTLEGEMRAEPGDWVICGVKGEFYPCKPDIFEATYDAVGV